MIADLGFYIKLIPRRLPVMLLLLVSSVIAGLIVAQRLPAVYAASATLLVESARIANESERPTGQASASEQLQVIQQRLLTRDNLFDIANDVGVFPEQDRMTPDRIVRAMRTASDIQLTIGANQATVMRLGFRSRSPETVAEVVNRYVDIALTISSDVTNSQAEETVAFFRQEVQSYFDELDQQSAKIAAFKRENADALPENLEYNQTRQSLLQERVSRAERELDSLATQRANIMRVFDATGSVSAPGQPALSAGERLLLELESELSIARSIYAASNPRVLSLESQVGALRSRMETAAREAPSRQLPPPTAQQTALEISLAEIDSRASTLEQEVADASAELLRLRSRIERIPANGIVLSGLEREQENIQNLYNAAVGRLAQAQSSLNIVMAAKGERITLLEAASVPDEPAGPNRTRIALIGGLVGIGLAGGFFVVLELLNQNVRRPGDIVKSMGISPLATIPRVETRAQKRWRRALQIGGSLVALTSVPLIAWGVDTYMMPLDQLAQRIMDRLT